MEVFLNEVLTGSHVTQQRHLRQARVIQAAIVERGSGRRLGRWKQKHLILFLEHRMSNRSEATRYYYALTIRLLARSLETSWDFNP